MCEESSIEKPEFTYFIGSYAGCSYCYFLIKFAFIACIKLCRWILNAKRYLNLNYDKDLHMNKFYDLTVNGILEQN